MLQLLLPPANRLAQPLPGALSRAFGRADIDRDEDVERALQRAFPAPAMPWPVAALSRLADAAAPDIARHGWLRADPALIQPDLAGARLMAIGGSLPLTARDVDAFLPDLQPLFAADGFVLDAPVPQRWYLRLPASTALPDFPSPEAALGEDPFDHPPTGAPALVRRWRVLANEAQVVLHNHPHNARRRAAGLPAVNSLWFHGGGGLPDAATSRFPTVLSDDPLLHGLAKLAKVDAQPIPGRLAAMPEPALVDLRAVPPTRLVDAWLLPALARGGRQCWSFEGGPGVRLAGAQRLRVWRRPLARLPA